MSSIDRYLPYINNAIAQKGQARANQYQSLGSGASELLNVLGAMLQKQQQQTEADNFYKDQITSTTPQANVTTDLLGKPLTQNKPVAFYPQGDARNQMPSPVLGRTVTTTEQGDLSRNPAYLIQALMNSNPEIVRRATAGIQGIQMTAPKREPLSQYGTEDVNPFSKTYGQRTEAIEKMEKPSYDDRTVLDENGKPKIVDVNGVKFYAEEKYDRNTQKGIPNSITLKKFDDNTAPPNRYAELSEQRLIKSYQQSFNSDPTIKAVREQGLSLGAVDSLIKQAKSGNQVSAAALGVKMAKVMGEVGMLSESDVTRYVQARSLSQGGADVLNKWINGVPTDATLNQINEIATVLRDEFKGKSKAIVENHVNQMSEGLGISPEKAKKYLSVESLFGKEQKSGSNDLNIDINDFENWKRNKK